MIDDDLVKQIGPDLKQEGYKLICRSYPVSDCTLEVGAKMPTQKVGLMPDAHQGTNEN